MAEKEKSPSNYRGFVAGVASGVAKLSVGHPFDTIKVRLQTSDSTRFSGPLQCLMQTIRKEGVAGLYKGATPPLVGTPAVNFWAGGLSAQFFWITSYPSDVVKQRLMTDPLGGGLGDGERKFRSWREAARGVYREGGARGFWRGFAPCFLRAFPANAVALVAFEGVMRSLP
ncbi:mitochondrial carrier protein [Diplocarpon rosae]|nr:mitochondrial carrier protein [Diplocarpon rosae]